MPPSEPPKGTRSSKRRKPPRQAPSSTARQNAAFGSRPARALPKPVAAPRPSRPPTVARPLAARPPRGIQAGRPVRTPADKRSVQRAARQEAQKAARQAQQTAARAVRAAAVTGGNFDVSAPNNKSAADRAAAKVSRATGTKVYRADDKHYYKQVKRVGLPDRHIPVDPFTGRTDRPFQLSGRAKGGDVEQASIQAPALKILDQTTRPLHGIQAQNVAAIKRGGIKEAFIGVHAPGSKAAKESRHAFTRGLQLKDRALGSDVLKAAGVKNKAARGVGGFALDVLADPLTYVTGGTGSVADRAALKATRVTARKAGVKAAVAAAETTAGKTAGKVAADAEKQALRKGAKPRQAAKAGKRAGQQHVRQAGDTAQARFTAGPARRAAEAAPAGRGVTVKVAGVEVPGVRRATAKVARGGRKLTRKVVGRNVSENVPAVTRSVIREVAPRVAPSSALRDEHMVGRAQTRAARSTVSHGAERADIFERTLKEQVPDQADRNLIIDALERGNISHVMGPAYRKALKTAKGDRRKALEIAKQADPKDFAHRESLAKIATQLRSELGTVHQRALRAGAHQKTTVTDFLTPRDVKDLGRTITKEQQHRKDVVRRLADRETHARQQATLTQQAATIRHAGRTAVQRQQEIARTRDAVARATRAWRQELAKPVTQRRGVPALEARVQQTRAAWEQARRPVTTHITEAPRAVGPGESQAAGRAAARAQETAAAEAQVVAAHNVPARKAGESHEAYLGRVRQYAADHNLPRLHRKANTLLAKKPAQQARGYYPHETASRISSGARGFVERATGVSQEARGGGQARTVKRTTAGQRRIQNVPISVANPQRAAKGLEPFSRDPVVVGNHLREAARATSQGEFAQNMAAAVGRPVKRGETVADHEDLYKLGYEGGKFGLHRTGKLKPPKTLKGGGQYVAMPKDFFEMMQKSTKGTATDNPLLMVLDRAQGGWKKAAITSLAFQIRNMIGDIQAGYYAPGLGGSLGKIPQASRAVARHSELARNLQAPATHATVKVAGKHMPLDEFLKGAMDNGVLDSGVIAHDVLQDTASGLKRIRAKGATTRPGRVARRGGRAVNRWITNRENVMRLATYKSGLDRGLKPAEAADMANLFHIDYSELSKSERAFFRRAMPFYTWTARSLPVAGLTMIQRPGKFANLEALREETGAAFTGQTEEQQRAGMPASVKRQVPFVIRVAGSNYGVSASLPLTLLNEFPGGAGKKDLGAWMDELSHFGAGMVGPYGGIKPAAERLVFNRSAYTRQDIKDPRHPLVPAPAWIAKAPDWVKKMTGATLIVDPNDKTGPKMWGWKGTADWTSRQVSLGVLQQASTAAAGARPGSEKLPTAAAIASPAVGVRIDKLGKPSATRAETQKLRDELAKLDERATILNQQGVTTANATPEYKALRKRINEITHILRPTKKKGGGRVAPLPLGGGGAGGKLPLGGGGAGGKLPLG